MSHDAREWVWEHSTSKGTARLVLALIADRCCDGRCVAYASVPSLMKRANASRTAVREALAKLIAAGELEQIAGRKGPRGETYYRLPLAATGPDQPSGSRESAPPSTGPEHEPVEGPGRDPGARITAPSGTGFRPAGGAVSGPQNRSEPKVNGRYSSSPAPIPAAQWETDAASWEWSRRAGHLARLGEAGLRAADDKWRAYRSTSTPRPAAAWAADWRAWIAREHTPAPPQPTPALGGARPATGMTRADAHLHALLDAVAEATGTE
ncbi:helix-turn-helix domain-containing protein [Streptomyces sp. P6-2-1]|uniref:helix-turn-helix domain-containing protein n=1 Tax=Streptomyces sp. P6-2-1 TaxID=3422591 RepID=UPI003D3607BB